MDIDKRSLLSYKDGKMVIPHDYGKPVLYCYKKLSNHLEFQPEIVKKLVSKWIPWCKSIPSIIIETELPVTLLVHLIWTSDENSDTDMEENDGKEEDCTEDEQDELEAEDEDNSQEEDSDIQSSGKRLEIILNYL